MITESQIREHLANYLAGSESLDSFEDWLVAQSWNMHRDSSEVAQELVNQIELRLSEHSDGLLSEKQLREELYQFLERFIVSIVEIEEVTTRVRRVIFSTASAQTLPLEALAQAAFAR
jgi:hypothetical protein